MTFSIIGVDIEAKLALEPGKIVIGRNLLELNCSDKKVSRNHALIELEGGRVWLTGTHINPCFLHDQDGISQPLPKGERHCLKSGDKFSLLPNKYIYRISSGENHPSVSTSTSTNNTENNKSKSKSNAGNNLSLIHI